VISFGEKGSKFQAFSEGLPSESGSRHYAGMRNTSISALCLTLATLAGCAAISGGSDTAPVDPTDPCGAQGYTGFLGSNISAVTLPADLNDRVARTGDAVTADFDPSRLNIETNDDSLIIGLSCG
jgi:hypothetical protein